MPVDQDLKRLSFQKLTRQLTKLATKPAPENVHKFRTYSRRVEALVSELVPRLDRNDKKLLKRLGRLRSKAGRVRDLDVQIASLRNLKIPQDPGRKSQLTRTLAEERAQREKKLGKAFDRKIVRELRRRLKRSARHEIPESRELLTLAVRQLTPLERDHAPLTEKILHQYRIAGKRARYLAELAGKDPEAEHLVDQLKRMQDVIGEWHDWLKLTEKAEKLFDGAQDSALLAALRNVTRAKFRRAVDALTETRAALSAKKPVSMQAAPGRKPPAEIARATTAVA
jgi:CHAD domain-containing protein